MAEIPTVGKPVLNWYSMWGANGLASPFQQQHSRAGPPWRNVSPIKPCDAGIAGRTVDDGWWCFEELATDTEGMIWNAADKVHRA